MSSLVLTYSVIQLQQSSDKGAHVKLLALQTKRFQGIKNKAPLRSLTWRPKGSCCCWSGKVPFSSFLCHVCA